MFREDKEMVLPPGSGQEFHYRSHLGLRVANLEESITELEGRGARFVMTLKLVREFQKKKQNSGRPFLETDYMAPPLTRARIDAGEFRDDVAIFRPQKNGGISQETMSSLNP